MNGEVVYVKKGSKVGGLHKRYYFLGNRIVLRHKNGEYTAYEHMKYGGVLVRIGHHDRLQEARKENKKRKQLIEEHSANIELLPEPEILALPADMIKETSELYYRLMKMITGEA